MRLWLRVKTVGSICVGSSWPKNCENLIRYCNALRKINAQVFLTVDLAILSP